MTHLLDTNTCIEHLRRGTGSPVTAKLAAAPAGSVSLCSVVIAELLYGAQRSANPAPALAQVRGFCSTYASFPFEERAAEAYAWIRAHLVSLGTPIGANDYLIAAIAVANGATLVTHNTAEFGRVPGLALEDWQIP